MSGSKGIIKWLIVCGLLSTCTEKEPAPATSPTEASLYLDQILTFIETNSIYRKTIDWTAYRKDTKEKAAQAKTIAETYQAIEFAIKQLNDNHSYYRLANGRSVIYFDSPCPEFDNPPDVIPPPNIGYIRIPGFDGFVNGLAAEKEFAQSLQDKIKNQDHANLKGWIVDLRGNAGGNMNPMLVGVGPILGEGICGYFIDADERAYEYGYVNGARSFSEPLVANPYKLIKPNPKVAVLIGLTGSSGEAITGAFVGRPDTQFFGAHGTCGQTTGIQGVTLSDGAILGVAATFMADRNKNKFKGSILPDNKGDGTVNGAVTAAIEWLNN